MTESRESAMLGPTRSRIASRILAWLPLSAWSATIFWLSSQPRLALPFGFRGADKALHFGAYALWAGLCILPLRWTWPRLRRATLFLLAGLFGTLYGASHEWHQTYVAGREAELLDLVADALGSIVGACSTLALWDRLARRRRRPEAR